MAARHTQTSLSSHTHPGLGRDKGLCDSTVHRRPYISKEQSAIFNLHNSVGSMTFNRPILCIFNTPLLYSFTQFHAEEPFQV